MKSYTRFVIPGVLLLFFGSCSVKDHLRPVEQQCQTVEEISRSPNFENEEEIIEVNGQKVSIGKSRIHEFEYDDQGRIIRYTDKLGWGNKVYEQTFEYHSNFIKLYTYQPSSPEPNSVGTLDINDQGLLISSTTQYKYDADGYLIEERAANGFYTKYTILDGNTVKMEQGNGNNPPTFVLEKEFDLSKRNPSPRPFQFYGKKDKNLLIKSSSHSYNESTNQWEDQSGELNYIFDKNGEAKRLINLKFDQNTVGGEVLDYTVTCQ